MTTLSKEDIVRWARSAGFSGTHSNVLMADGEDLISLCKLEEFATLARADIVKANKALVAENERLKNYLSGERDKLLDTANTIDQLTDQLINQLTATRAALAAAQAREEKLRKAIVMFRCEKAVGKAHSVRKTEGYAAMQYAVFDHPHDDSALREMIAGVYEECAKACEASSIKSPSAQGATRATMCAENIRALAEKAKA